MTMKLRLSLLPSVVSSVGEAQPDPPNFNAARSARPHTHNGGAVKRFLLALPAKHQNHFDQCCLNRRCFNSGVELLPWAATHTIT